MNAIVEKHRESCYVKRYSFSSKPVYEAVKRILDIFFSVIALVILFPIMLIISVIIYIDDPGTIIFKQKRIGQNGKEFIIYKFRSMKNNAEETKSALIKQNSKHGVNFKMADDPRTTRVGRFIRKTSIDELPQLLNVLKGDMSIIGPRPFIEKEQIALPTDRLLVKPGLSCYWQIGGKNNLSLHEQIELDRKYIQERSVWVDFKIIILTMIVVFKNKNE